MKKNITTKLLAILCCVSVFTVSCKNDATEIGLAAPSAANFKALRNQALKDLVQSKTFKAEDGITFTSAKGAKFSIGGNCLLDENNNNVSGDVTLSFIEIYDRGNMVATNKPVMGKDNDGNLLPLVTGGEYDIKIEQDGKELHPGCMFQVYIPAANTGSLDGSMILWKGEINDDGNLQWEEVKAAGQEGGLRANEQSVGYDIWGNEFGWANVDRFYSDPRPKTQIKVTVPEGYNNQNSGVYLAYENEPNVLAQLDTYDTEERFFSEHYGFIPVGMNLHVIFVSESNGYVVYAIKPATIVADGTIAIQNDDIATTTKNNLITLINALN
ncbi:MAG TPA: hypothetical protein PKA53_01825 [Sphingobacterium sp.]|nr:hypothetical protein [Sphingobacterium sp.]